ncbi:MAG TPA: DNA alkylation repair protein [Solirubrobacteraceae bacterium]|nr:DNA alkylation repair protein [Solirubrobacteraceae bacterium]
MSRSLPSLIEAGLAELGTPGRAAQEKRYLKSELDHFGASLPATRRLVGQTVAERPGVGHDELVEAVDVLWARGIHDCRTAAVELLRARADALGPDDLDLVERLVRGSSTWALVDPLAEHVAGDLVTRYPGLVETLDRWSGDDDFWIRRSAMLALLRPLRQGAGDFDRFGGYADRMLDEREFFIRKAIGWILRDTSRRRPDLVYAWLAPRAARCSGVTIREAVKHLSADQRAAILDLRARPGAVGRPDA